MAPLLKLNYMLSRNSANIFVATLAAFLFSLFFSPYYYGGDQRGYTAAYEAVFGHNFIDGFIAYNAHVSSAEPVHYLVVWVASNLGLKKNIVMAVANAILANLLFRLLIKWRVSVYIAWAIVFTNFYVLVLYFAAERLKFGFIFLLLALLASKKPKRASVFSALSILAHAQMIIFYASHVFSVVSSRFLTTLKTLKISRKNKFEAVFTISIVICAAVFLREHIFRKFGTYSENAGSNSIFEIWKTVVFLILSLMYSSSHLKTIFIFIVIISAVVVVGPERVNMVGYCFFLFYALQRSRGVNAAIILTSMYFGVKSIAFVLDVIDTGQGF